MNPKVSIIVPVFDDPYIFTAIESITTSQQSKTLDIETLIVVNGGNSDMYEKLCDYIKDLSFEIRILYQEQKGLGSAKNFGAREATGEYLCFIDSDCMVTQDYLLELSEAIKFCTNRKVVRGRVVHRIHSEKRVLRKIGVIRDYYFESIKHQAATPNLIISKDYFLDHNVYALDFVGEDTEFAQRLEQDGCEVVYLDDLTIHHYDKVSLRQLRKNWYFYGRTTAYKQSSGDLSRVSNILTSLRVHGVDWIKFGLRDFESAFLLMILDISYFTGLISGMFGNE